MKHAPIDKSAAMFRPIGQQIKPFRMNQLQWQNLRQLSELLPRLTAYFNLSCTIALLINANG